MLKFILQHIHEPHRGGRRWTGGPVWVSKRTALYRNPRRVKRKHAYKRFPRLQIGNVYPPSENLWWGLCGKGFVAFSPLCAVAECLAIMVSQQHCPQSRRLLRGALGRAFTSAMIVFCVPAHPSRLHTMNRCGQVHAGTPCCPDLPCRVESMHNLRSNGETWWRMFWKMI